MWLAYDLGSNMHTVMITFDVATHYPPESHEVSGRPDRCEAMTAALVRLAKSCWHACDVVSDASSEIHYFISSHIMELTTPTPTCHQQC